MVFSEFGRAECAENWSPEAKRLPTRQMFFHFGVQSLTRSAPYPRKVSFFSYSDPTTRGGSTDSPCEQDKQRHIRMKEIHPASALSHKSARPNQTATVKVSSLRVTARYIVSRSKGSRPASVISRTRSARRIPCGVIAPASW